MKLIVGITGASGAIYARRLLDRVVDFDVEVAVVFSDNAEVVWKQELGEEISLSHGIVQYNNKDFFAPFASGSSGYDAMVICPCSMGTLGRIATGISDSLITRAADVMLKESRKLILVPREMPYNLIHVDNMKRLILAGATIIPASPSFYSRPDTIVDLVDTVIDKIFLQLGFDFNRFKWGNGI